MAAILTQRHFALLLSLCASASSGCHSTPKPDPQQIAATNAQHIAPIQAKDVQKYSAPEVRIVLPAKQPDKAIAPEAPNQKNILPADYIADVKPIDREPIVPASGLSEKRVPPVDPEVKFLNPTIEAPAPVKPQILHLLPDKDDGFHRSDPFKKADGKEAEPKKPTSDGKPKAWLEMPVPDPRSVRR